MEGIPAVTSFDPHLKLLRISGYARLKNEKSHYRIFHEVYRTFVVVYLTVTFSQESIYMVTVTNNTEKFVASMLLLITHWGAYLKFVIYRLREDRVLNMLNVFTDPLFNNDVYTHKVILKESAVTARLILHTFLFIAMATCAFWTVFPIMDYCSGKHVELAFWFGFLDYNRSPIFELVLTYTMAMVTIVAIGNPAIDSLIGCVLAQCKTQLTLLRMNFENLFERSQKCSEEKSESLEETLNNELLKCIKHYEKIDKTIKEYQALFGTVVFIQFNASGWIFCMIAYRVVIINALTWEVASLLVYFCGMLIELFAFCYYGNEVKYESDRIIESIYQMNWLPTSQSFKKSLIIVMERNKRPIAPTAMKLIPLSLDTFITIVKSSYTFYAVLSKTQD